MLLVLGFAFARLLPPGTQDKTAGSSDRSGEGALDLVFRVYGLWGRKSGDRGCGRVWAYS